MWAREGISLSRATMANWVIQCSQSWLKPLYKHMKQELLIHSVIHADETVVQVLKEDGKPATSESRMWLYASAALIRHQVRLFEYQPDRSGKRPEAFLKGFTGALVTDGRDITCLPRSPIAAAGLTPEENGGKQCRRAQR